MKTKMYLITKDFPYGHGEESFVKPEYPYLCKKFDVLVIAAEVKETEHVQNKDVKAYMISNVQRFSDKLVSFLSFLCEKDCHIEIAAIIKGKKQIVMRIYRALMFGTAAETFYRRLKKMIKLNKDTEALFYFYWFDYKCFGLSMHKDKFPNIQIIARTHGYDLYDERELYGKQFFKPQMDAKLERLIFAAQYAKDYYLDRYQKEESEKYPVHRLGVSDKRMTCEKRREELVKDSFLLVSCSHAISIKRIDRIIDGLSMVADSKIRWIHLGGGDQLTQLQERAQDKLGGKINIEYYFPGAMTNDKVLQFYRENYVGCFITTTETEGGSPVSVQEALSFGIPIIATGIGELPQMVKGNGILLSDNPIESEVGQAIEQMAEIYNTEEYFSMCRSSLMIFEEKFNAENNFMELIRDLEGLKKS